MAVKKLEAETTDLDVTQSAECLTALRLVVSSDEMQFHSFKDIQLVKAIKAGNNKSTKAFDVLFDRYRQRVYGYTVRLLKGKRDITDDINQKIWLKVITKIDTYNEDGEFMAWLFSIARNTVFDEVRRSNRRTEFEFDEFRTEDTIEPSAEEKFGFESDDPEEMLSKFENLNLLRKEVDELPMMQRAVVLTWLNGDTTRADLAEELGITAKAFEGLLFRAKQKLIRKLGVKK